MPGEWIKAWQFDPSITPGKTRIDLALLDRIAPNNPLFLYEPHVNAKALVAAGVTRDTPDPPQRTRRSERTLNRIRFQYRRNRFRTDLIKGRRKTGRPTMQS
jgi:predicted amidohydrolase YtcJ